MKTSDVVDIVKDFTALAVISQFDDWAWEFLNYVEVDSD